MLKHVPTWLRFLYSGLLGAFVVYAILQAREAIQTGMQPDWMFLTGSSACLVGIWAILGIEARVVEAVTDMIEGGVIVGPPGVQKVILAEIDRASAATALAGLAFVVGAEFVVVVSGHVLVPWLVQGMPVVWTDQGGVLMVGDTDALSFAGLLLSGLATATLVGWYLGKFAAYGRLQQRVEACGGQFVMQPGATDKMGGLQPLVRIVRGQALLTLAPVVWIVLWLVLTAVNDYFLHQYGFWRLSLFILLIVAVFYAIQGFFAPLRMLERVLKAQEARAKAMGGPLGEQVRFAVINARRHITPRPPTFLILMAFFAASIVVSGLGLPFSTFLFGPT